MKHWLSAFRLRTLPLAVSSILVGSALAESHDSFRWPVVFLALLTAVLLQVLSNLANDLGDHQHGTDNSDRIGPQRAVQSGTISPVRMKRGMVICGVLAFVSGCSLITVALGMTTTALMFLLIGLVAIAAAVKYTFGRNPYGYAGLGDLSVFIFFGLVGVLGTFYLHTGRFAISNIPVAFAFGLLSAGVLNVNNMRDIQNDAASGKRTLVVRMGSARAKSYHIALIAISWACLLLIAVLLFNQWYEWLFLFALPGFVIHLKRVLSNTEPRLLDPQLKTLAMTTFLTAILFSLGLILA